MQTAGIANKPFTKPTLMRSLMGLGLCMVYVNIDWLAMSLDSSNTFIPAMPDIHLYIAGGWSALITQSSGIVDVQPILGLGIALALLLVGPGVVLSVFLHQRPKSIISVFAMSFPLFFLHCINVDWLFIQALHFVGIKWMLAMSIFVVFAIKMALSLSSVYASSETRSKHSTMLGASAFSALLVLYLAKVVMG